MKKIHLLIISILFCLSYNFAKAQNLQSFIVEGEIDTVAHATYYVRYYEGDKLFKDTIKLDSHKKFVLQRNAQEPVFIYLTVENIYDETLVGNFYFYEFWAEPGKTTYFKGEKGQYNQIVNNSVPEDLSIELSKRKTPINQQLRSIRLRSGNPEPNDLLLRDSLRRELDNIGIEFIKENSNSYYAASLIRDRVKFNKAYNPIVKTLFDGLADSIKTTKMGKSISALIESKQSIQIGQVLPDFTLNNTLGNPVQLSEFRGKYVLVEFWASWCAPCRKENPNLVRAYQKYHPKGFEILSISLDEEKDAWLKAIKDDSLNWIHVSDLKEFNSEVAKQFNIRAVPDNFLLDQEGKIIARNLRNEDLNKKLAELL